MSTPIALKTSINFEMSRLVAGVLNVILADSFAMYLKAKNFHWHVSGPHFRAYHEMFDDQAAQILSMTDAIAERVRKTGGTTLRSIGHIARLQRIDDSDVANLSPRDMLLELHGDNLLLARELREARTIVDSAGESVSSSLLDELIDQAEERAWVLFESSRETDKNVSTLAAASFP